MNVKKAIAILAKFFVVDADVFSNLAKARKETVIQWATEVTGKNYQLTWTQHQFLIGQVKVF